MARATRITSIEDTPDGTGIEVSYLSGVPPLPVDGQTGSFVYGKKKEIEEAIKEFEASLTDQQLLMLHMAAAWLKADGTLKNRGNVVGTTMTLDMYAQKIVSMT
jgi:hypothetical protein